MTSEKNNSAKDFLLQLFNKYHSEQQKTDQKKFRAKLRSDMEQDNLRLLELRRTAIENLSGIELERRLKLYDDYESVFKKLNDLTREHVYGDNEKYLREWDSVVNEYKSLLQREKLYEKVGQQSKQQGQNIGGKAGESPQSTPETTKQRAKRGRQKKYTPTMAKQMHDMFEQCYEKNNDAKGSWNEVAKYFSIKSGKAAEMACRRYLHKKNK